MARPAAVCSTPSLIMILAISLATIFSPSHASSPAIFSFGDSLSDVGNNNDLPDAYHANFPHYGVDFPGGVATGRFTNGYNLIDVIAQHMGFEQSPPDFASVSKGVSSVTLGVNFASGGAGILLECTNGTDKECITMYEQINNFRSAKTMLEQQLGKDQADALVSRSLFIFTCGSNDLNSFFKKYFDKLPFAPIDDFVHNLTSALRCQLMELYVLGARKFLLINVPAIGMTPTATALDHISQRILNYFAENFNEAEAKMIKGLSSDLPGMKYSVGNAYTVIMDVATNPTTYGLNNTKNPCCGDVKFVPVLRHIEITYCSPTASLCPNRSEYIFWDNIHPTLRVINYAAEVFFSGNQTYASPINLSQLVEYEPSSGRGGARGSFRGIASFLAM